MEISSYRDKSDVWWEKAESDFDVWIEEKFKYCLHYGLKAIADASLEGGDEKFLYPCIVDIIGEKNTFSGSSKCRTLTPESMFKAFKKYSKFVSEINKYVFFLPNKQTFCSFINISVSLFNEMQRAGDKDLSAVIDMINDYFVSNIAHAGQSGMAKSSVVSLMLKAEEDGQGIMTAKESKTTQNMKPLKSIDEIDKAFNAITDGK